VGNAVLIRRDQERQFHDNLPAPVEVDESELLKKGPLELDHYREAVRKNRGFARRKNILFGDF